MSFQVLMHSLRQAAYNKIRAIRLWKCDAKGDESVRSVCHYLESETPVIVEELQCTDINLTELGCEFIGRALGGRERIGGELLSVPPITYLRLDYNHIGGRGVEQLAKGLAQNSTLRALSCEYCAIGPDGGQPFSNILMYHASALEQIRLRGNELRDEGGL